MKKPFNCFCSFNFSSTYTFNLVFGGTIKYTNKQVEAQPQKQRNSLSLA